MADPVDLPVEGLPGAEGLPEADDPADAKRRQPAAVSHERGRLAAARFHGPLASHQADGPCLLRPTPGACQSPEAPCWITSTRFPTLGPSSWVAPPGQ